MNRLNWIKNARFMRNRIAGGSRHPYWTPRSSPRGFEQCVLKYLGHSLLELLIALSLGLFLMGGLLSIQAMMNRQYQRIKDSLDNTINAAWVISLLRDSIRRAGFTPCMPLGALKTSGLRPFIIEPHRLMLNRMDNIYQQVSVVQPDWISLSQKKSYATNTPYLLSDCYHAEIVTIESSQNGLHLEKPLQYAYEPPVYLGAWISEVFFISEGEKPALMYRVNGTTQRLVETHLPFEAQAYAKREHFFISLLFDSFHIETRVRAS